MTYKKEVMSHVPWERLDDGYAFLLVDLLDSAHRGPGGPGAAPPTPLELLERRYAVGEISTEEFEERKVNVVGNLESTGFQRVR